MKAIRVFHICSTARVCALVVCMMFATAALADSKESIENIDKELKRFLSSKNMLTKRKTNGKTFISYNFKYVFSEKEMAEENFVPEVLLRFEKTLDKAMSHSTESMAYKPQNGQPSPVKCLRFLRPDNYMGETMFYFELENNHNYRYVNFSNPENNRIGYILIWKHNRFTDKDGKTFASIDGYVSVLSGNQWRLDENTRSYFREEDHNCYVRASENIERLDTTQYAKFRDKLKYAVNLFNLYNNKKDENGMTATAYFIEELCKNYEGILDDVQNKVIDDLLLQVFNISNKVKSRSRMLENAIMELNDNRRLTPRLIARMKWRSYSGGMIDEAHSKTIVESDSTDSENIVQWQLTGTTHPDRRFIEIITDIYNNSFKYRFDDGNIYFNSVLPKGTFVTVHDSKGIDGYHLLVDGVPVDIDMPTGELRKGSETNRRYIAYQKRLKQLKGETEKYAIYFDRRYIIMDQKGYEALFDTIMAFKYATIKANLDNEIAATVLSECYPSLSFQQLDTILKSGMRFGEAIERPAYDYYQGLKKRQPGLMFSDVALEDAEGKMRRLSEFIDGKRYVLLHFWGTGCWWSRRTMSSHMRAAKTYTEDKLKVIGISPCRDKADWKKYITDRNMNWTQLVDTNQFDSEITKFYGIRSLPESIIIGPDGRIVAEGLQGKPLTDKLKELLGE